MRKIFDEIQGKNVTVMLDLELPFRRKKPLGTEMDTNNKTMCANFSNSPGVDELYIGCYLIIPKDAPIEAKTDTWTFTGTAI